MVKTSLTKITALTFHVRIWTCTCY